MRDYEKWNVDDWLAYIRSGEGKEWVNRVCEAITKKLNNETK